MKWIPGYRKFGLTQDSLTALEKAQNGVCAICGCSNTHKLGLVVDHDHRTQKLRGLLCHNCNVGLGNFQDSIGNLEAAIQYLSKFLEGANEEE